MSGESKQGRYRSKKKGENGRNGGAAAAKIKSSKPSLDT
jgi:hypothetical protein